MPSKTDDEKVTDSEKEFSEDYLLKENTKTDGEPGSKPNLKQKYALNSQQNPKNSANNERIDAIICTLMFQFLITLISNNNNLQETQEQIDE
ncbi:hypothetical protein COBT_002476, partial [Conglomerata obtusa]